MRRIALLIPSFFLIGSMFLSPLSGDTLLLLHGSFAAQSTWYKKRGDFHDALEKSAPDTRIVPHTWSGSVAYENLVDESYALADSLLHYYKPQEKLLLVGHSNGGAVSAFASMLLSYARGITQAKELIAPFIASEFYQKKLAERKGKKKSAVITPEKPIESEKSDSAEDFIRNITQKIEEKKVLLQEHLLKRHNENDDEQKPFVTEVYLLGTPIKNDQFFFAMDVIEHIYNCYSRGDSVQAIVGDRVIPAHERVYNIEIGIRNPHQREKALFPTHTEIHSPLVGEYLLSFKDYIPAYSRAGLMMLSQTEKPVYTPSDVAA